MILQEKVLKILMLFLARRLYAQNIFSRHLYILKFYIAQNV